MSDDVAALRAALGDRARTAEALERALALWRATPLPSLADLIERLGATAPPPAIKWERGKDEGHRQWLALAADYSPSVAGALLEALTARLPIASELYGILDADYAARKYRALLERLAAIRRWPADPRAATRLVRLLADGAYSAMDRGSVETIYRPAVEAIVEIGDRRAAATLAAVGARPTSKTAIVREWLADVLPKAAARLEKKRAAAAPPSLIALVDEYTQASTTPAGASRSAEELLDEIVAHPDDDGTRAVYADLLTERGDPRGELITLQLALTRGEGSADKALRRIGSLLKRHGKEWLGPLAPVAKQPRWERGFLVECELQQNSAADERGWKEAAHAPALATVRRLVRGRANTTLYASFVTSPVMRSLVDVEAADPRSLEDFAGQPIGARLTRLRLGNVSAKAMDKNLAPPAFPSLRVLQLRSDTDDAVERAVELARLRPSLERIDLVLTDAGGAGWAERAARIIRGVLDQTSLAATAISFFGGATIGARRSDGGLKPIVEDAPHQYALEAADQIFALLGISR